MGTMLVQYSTNTSWDIARGVSFARENSSTFTLLHKRTNKIFLDFYFNLYYDLTCA